MIADMFKQCEVVKENRSMMTWLPEQFAVMNKHVRLKDDDGTWEPGWRVVWVGAESMPSERLPDHHEYRKAIRTRK